MLRLLSQKPNPIVFLATPLGKDGKMSIGTANFCGFIDKQSNVIWGHVKTLSAELSRNILIEDQLENNPNWTHILFLDSDTSPEPDALDKLLEVEAGVAVGLSPLYTDGGMYWNISLDDEKLLPYHEELPSVSEPFNIKAAGAGMMLIRREVLLMIGYPWFKMTYQSKYEKPGSPAIKEGEDIYFCRKVTELGYEIKAHPLVVCEHNNPVDLGELYNKLRLQIETKHVADAKI
jgi:hypothetical protein